MVRSITTRAVTGLLAIVLLLAVPGPARAAAPGQIAASQQEQVRLIVRHRPGAAAQAAGLIRAVGARAEASTPEIATQSISVDAEDAAAVSTALAADPRIEAVHPDVPVRAFGRTPNDPSWSAQWGPAHTGAPSAWSRTVGSSDVVIAVLDTGVAQLHPDLTANVITPGYDATTRRTELAPTDVHGHGTHVAGIAAATTDNARGIAGMCWRCRILPVKVLGEDGRGRYSDIEAGIIWATDRGADVIVMSLGTDLSTTQAPPSAAVAYAASKGVLLVAAAGNDGTTSKSWPAAFPEVVGVAASNEADARPPFSNHGSWVEVAAPGTGILSTVPGSEYAAGSGTSMAAPLVAGALGLARSHAPTLSVGQLRTALRHTSVPLGYVAHGRLDTAALLARVEQVERAPREVAATAGDGSATLTWKAPASDGGQPTTGYLVTGKPGGATREVPATATTATIDGLANGTAYTFTVAARSAGGTGPASPPSTAVTPAGMPGVPTRVSAIPGESSVRVTWRHADGNGAPITGYTVAVSPGRSVTVPGSSNAVTIDRLTNGISHTATVTASNRVGTGPSSAPTAAVIPLDDRPRAFDGVSSVTKRTTEATPVAVAAAVSLRRFAASGSGGPQAAHAVLSRDDDFPDSLAGAPLSATGPLLFTATAALPAPTAAELRRVLDPGGTVYLLGGTGAIAPAVADAVRGLGLNPVRLAGPSRIETALVIADEVRRLHPGERTVLVARAFGAPGNETSGWADSVTGGAYGASARVPVVLTATGAVHPALQDWVRRTGPSRTVLLGGVGALSEAVAAGLPRSERVAGPERTATASAVATRLWGTPLSGPRRFVVINGFHATGWAHGLAAAGAAADAKAPLLLVTPAVPAATQQLVAACGSSQVELFLVGGSAAIPPATAAELDLLDGAGC